MERLRRLSRTNRFLPGLLAFALPLACYALWAPHYLRAEDDAFFIAAAAQLGPAHAPGYPAWVFPAHWFLRLADVLWPGALTTGAFGAAWRLHLFNALCGALAAHAVYGAARALAERLIDKGNRPSWLLAWIACAFALVLAFSDPFRQQVALAEVYPLQAFLILHALRLSLQTKAARSGFLWALSLANHWPLTVLNAPILLTGLSAGRLLRGLALGLAAAIALYGTIFYLGAHPAEQPRGFDLIRTADEALGYVLRTHYLKKDQSDLHRGPFGPDDQTHASDLFIRLAFGLTPLTLCLALYALQRHPRAQDPARYRLVVALGAVVVLQTLFLLILLKHPADVLWRTVRVPYGVIADALLCALATCGLWRLWPRLQEKGPRWTQSALAACVLAPLTLAAYPQAQSPDDPSVERFGRLLMASIPDNALFVSMGDVDSAVFAYFQHFGLGHRERRPDVLSAVHLLTAEGRHMAGSLRLTARPDTPIVGLEDVRLAPDAPTLHNCLVSDGLLLRRTACPAKPPAKPLKEDLLQGLRPPSGWLAAWQNSPNGFLKTAWDSTVRNLGAWRERALRRDDTTARARLQALQIDAWLGEERAFLHGRLLDRLENDPAADPTDLLALWTRMRRTPAERLAFEYRRERQALTDIAWTRILTHDDPSRPGRFRRWLHELGVPTLSATPHPPPPGEGKFFP